MFIFVCVLCRLHFGMSIFMLIGWSCMLDLFGRCFLSVRLFMGIVRWLVSVFYFLVLLLRFLRNILFQHFNLLCWEVVNLSRWSLTLSSNFLNHFELVLFIDLFRLDFLVSLFFLESTISVFLFNCWLYLLFRWLFLGVFSCELLL